MRHLKFLVWLLNKTEYRDTVILGILIVPFPLFLQPGTGMIPVDFASCSHYFSVESVSGYSKKKTHLYFS